MNEYLSFNLADDTYESGTRRKVPYSRNIISLCECLDTFRECSPMYTTIAVDGFCALCGHASVEIDTKTSDIKYVNTPMETLISITENGGTLLSESAESKFQRMKYCKIPKKEKAKLARNVLIECKYNREECMRAFRKEKSTNLTTYLLTLDIKFMKERKEFLAKNNITPPKKILTREEILIKEAKVLCRELDEMRKKAEGKK